MFRAIPRSTPLIGITMSGLLGLGLIATADVAEAGIRTLDVRPSLTGTITLGSTGRPVVGAEVKAIPDDGYTPTVATTDAAGKYSFLGLEGSFTVKVSRTEGSNFLDTFAGNTVREPNATHVTIGSEDVTKDIHAVPGARVIGKILLADGTPAKNVPVSATNTTRYGYTSATTNGDGVYSLTGLASGRVTVVTWSETGTRSRSVIAKQGSTVRTKTMKQASSATGRITGKIQGAKYLKGHEIQAIPSKGGSPETLVVGSRGRVSQSVAPGTYRVFVSGAGLRSKSIVVKQGKKANFGTLAMPRKSTTLKGRIKLANGKPAAGVYLGAVDANGTFLGGAQTSSSGAYKIPGAISGTYQIYASAPKGTGSVGDSVTVSVKKGARAVTKNVTLAGYSLSGVVSYKGKPVQGATVALDGFLGYAVTDSKGRFKVGYATRGKHVISVTDLYTGGFRNKNVKLTVTKSRTGIRIGLTR